MSTVMSSKAINISGWVLTGLLALLFLFSAFMKFTYPGSDPVYGMSPETYKYIGFLEILCLILFIIPRTGVLGTLLLAAYMGGAIVTHLEHQGPIIVAVVVQMMLWIAAFLRFPELKRRLLTVRN